jgi:hypothetical protein
LEKFRGCNPARPPAGSASRLSLPLPHDEEAELKTKSRANRRKENMKMTKITIATTVEEIKAALLVGQVECRETGQWWELRNRRLSVGANDGNWHDVPMYTRTEAAQYIAEAVAAMAT